MFILLLHKIGDNLYSIKFLRHFISITFKVSWYYILISTACFALESEGGTKFQSKALL